MTCCRSRGYGREWIECIFDKAELRVLEWKGEERWMITA